MHSACLFGSSKTQDCLRKEATSGNLTRYESTLASSLQAAKLDENCIAGLRRCEHASPIHQARASQYQAIAMHQEGSRVWL